MEKKEEEGEENLEIDENAVSAVAPQREISERRERRW